MSRGRVVLLVVGAGLATGFTDGLFASVLSVLFYGSTETRLWQGVASTILGKDAFASGARTALIGLLMHFGVALGWSAVLMSLAVVSPSIRRAFSSPGGMLKLAAVYGPAIWLVMSLVVIPLLLHRPPTITSRRWIQGIGHIPFVALPMVAVIGKGLQGFPVAEPRRARSSKR
jgi:hypothetical protein